MNPESPGTTSAVKPSASNKFIGGRKTLASTALHQKTQPQASVTAFDTSDLQSQDSTSFELVSMRGGNCETTIEALPSISAEFETLPKVVVEHSLPALSRAPSQSAIE